MPIIQTNTLKAPFWLPDGHYQSIYPALFRKIKLPYTRERITTPDDDFLDLDWATTTEQGGMEQGERGPLVILSHGLEGSSTRQYITGMVRLLTNHGYDCLAWNFRSCSGPINRQPRFYHSGETTDLDFVIRHAIGKGYTEIYLMGFSLGGNVTLKYVGESNTNLFPQIRKAHVFSVPMDLSACSQNIKKTENKLYSWRFLNSLKPKVAAKSAMYPDLIDASKWKSLKTLWDFDNIYTGPLHGFAGAEDYYAKSSSMFFVKGITIPTLIVNAINDPLVPHQSLPIDVIANLSNVWLELIQEGGHCGFKPQKPSQKGVYWSEQRALAFLQNS